MSDEKTSGKVATLGDAAILVTWDGASGMTSSPFSRRIGYAGGLIFWVTTSHQRGMAGSHNVAALPATAWPVIAQASGAVPHILLDLVTIREVPGPAGLRLKIGLLQGAALDAVGEENNLPRRQSMDSDAPESDPEYRRRLARQLL